ncbi:MAG: alpha,alpha-trehalase TreF [Gemmatimonadaceae bacterium]|nr:alpha,alpha-trehalase TreF [Gemmatimonadaceae bacterium]
MSTMQSPRELYGELFEAVQRSRLYRDSKTFVDAVPRGMPEAIVRQYRTERERPGFDLGAFVQAHFDLPAADAAASGLAPADDVRAQVDRLWDKLVRPADPDIPFASLIPLPHRYVVPGGRFRELYYWDSYFTMLGLAVSGRHDILGEMVANFASLVDRIGFIPNGTRTYYGTRSQPPLFVLMVELLAQATGDTAIVDRYGAQLEREYAFWMAGGESLAPGQSARRVVRFGDVVLNRYWDDAAEPRQESYAEDLELAAETTREASDLFRDLRAACESGWDFSSRWFDETRAFASIRTTSLLPVDLNSILFHLETVLAGIRERGGDIAAATRFRDRAAKRRALLRSLFFDESHGFFCDVHHATGKSTGILTLAGAWPLFVGVATDGQAQRVADRLRADFLRPGGWVTTLTNTGQQWDAPNGWAPLQWIVVEGLRRYGFTELAHEGARRWIDANTSIYRQTGHFLEKYDVEHPGRVAGGGEYAVQDGFGWTNGVLVQLLSRG